MFNHRFDRLFHYLKPPTVKEPLKLDPSSIQMLYEIGQGEYGSVLKGIWTCPSGEKVKIH